MRSVPNDAAEVNDYSIVIAQDLGVVVVSVQGELDQEALIKLEAILAELIAYQALTVAVDARAMSLAEPTGAWLFRRAQEWAHERGRAFCVQAPSESVYRALRASGLEGLVQVAADADSSLLRLVAFADSGGPRFGHRSSA